MYSDKADSFSKKPLRLFIKDMLLFRPCTQVPRLYMLLFLELPCGMAHNYDEFIFVHNNHSQDDLMFIRISRQLIKKVLSKNLNCYFKP